MPERLAATAMLCRTSDRWAAGAAGAAAVGDLLGARMVGSPGVPHDGRWNDDLATARGCLLEAGGQVDDALDAGRIPLLLAGDCTVSIATLPVVARHRPDAWVLWIDAHPDFHTPSTTRSNFLGGMCLAGACGLWETGHGPAFDPARVALLGVRDVDGPEEVLLATHGVGRPETVAAMAGRPVFVHLDLDVLDPEVLPARFPAPGGLSFADLEELLARIADECELVGAEVTSAHPDRAEAITDALDALVESGSYA
jgi:arginase family enzyme